MHPWIIHKLIFPFEAFFLLSQTIANPFDQNRLKSYLILINAQAPSLSVISLCKKCQIPATLKASPMTV